MSGSPFEPAMLAGSDSRLLAASQYAHTRLSSELSPLLYYHSPQHTLNHVLTAALALADHSHLGNDDRTLLLTAVLFHDLGWTAVQGNTPEDYALAREHETRSAEITRQVLPGLGYSPAEIGLIQGMIMATRLPQDPHTLLEKIIVDADMSSIGRPDFWLTSMALREEMAAFGSFISELEWYERQYRLLNNFSFFSEAGRSLYEAQRQRNARAVRSRLVSLGSRID